MRRILFGLIGLVFISLSIQAQNFTLSGYVQDSASGEKLIGANIYDQPSLKGTTSNTYGFYSITLPRGEYTMVFSFVGYKAQVKKVNLSQNIQMTINLAASLELDAVEITGQRAEQSVESSQMSTINMPVKMIKQIPALMGEVDVIKAIQLLPGVQSGTEGTSGLYVRGGGPDQNLILLDGTPVYNASHLFGFFSVFNADAIHNVKLIKGGFRLAGILFLRTEREGQP